MFKNIPENWEIKQLGNLLEYEQPTKYIVQSENYSNEYKTPVLTAGKSFILGYTNETTGIFSNIPVIIFDDFTTDSKYVNFNFKVKSSAIKILKNSNINILKYLYYLMQTLPFDNSQHKRYWISSYSKIKIGIPTKEEEIKEIVQILDTASDIIRYRKECIKNAQDLIPALFQEMFGENILQKMNKQHLGTFFDVGTGATPSRDNSEYYIGKNPWVKTTEVNNCYIDSTLECISDEALQKTNCSIYPTGTILMAMYGQGKTRGKVAYLNIPAATNQACAAIELKQEYENSINRIFVFYYLQIIYDFLRTLSQGGGRPNMNLSIVRNIPLFLPNIEKQNLYVNRVIEIEKYIEEQTKELEKSESMFQSLLHHAFTGELTRRAYGTTI